MKKKLSFHFKCDIFLFIFFLILSSILISFSGGSFVINFKAVGFGFISGTEKTVYAISSFITDTVLSIRELAELKVKYKELTEQLKDYELLQRTNADIRRENRELKQLLHFSKELPSKNIPAQIIGFDPDNLYSSIMINCGTKQGVRKNMPVLAFQGSNIGLVGKIVQARLNTSMVMPLYDYQCYVAARVQTTKDRGLINGQGNASGYLIMKYVQKRAKDDISIGDRVVASGENYLFPKESPIGIVKQIRVHDYESYLELLIEPILDFSRLDYVFVLDLSKMQKDIEL